METDPFVSILFPTAESRDLPLNAEEPAFFKDLHLGPLVSQASQSREGVDLRAYYYTMLRDPAVIRYRQEILTELEDPAANKAVSAFTETVFYIRRFLKQFRDSWNRPELLHDHLLEQGKLMHSAVQYCGAIRALKDYFRENPPRSEGFRRFSAFLSAFTEEGRFRKFAADTAALREKMDQVDYCLEIRGNTIRVEKYAGQEDFSASVTAMFEKFRQGEVQDYRHRVSEGPYCDETEEGILQLLAGLYPDEFRTLRAFCHEWFSFDEPLLLDFSNDVQFYLRWLDFIRPLKNCGLRFCCPAVRTDKRAMSCEGAFDLALAKQLFDRTIPNDFSLEEPERLIVITGPNQGGKTTFTRAFGQIHYLASIGLSIPGKRAELFLCEKILTHFEREEDLSSENGKLRDDLIRLRDLLEQADEKSLILINEIFASTTVEDALQLGKRMMDRLIRAGSPGVIVTFLDELAEYSPETVSMMSIVADDPKRTRTFKIRRKAPDGLAFAQYIAARHGLSAEELRRRLRA